MKYPVPDQSQRYQGEQQQQKQFESLTNEIRELRSQLLLATAPSSVSVPAATVSGTPASVSVPGLASSSGHMPRPIPAPEVERPPVEEPVAVGKGDQKAASKIAAMRSEICLLLPLKFRFV